MTTDETVVVRRPRRWDEPMDPHMTDADVAWLRDQMPFAALDPAAFPKTIPLEGILRHDCRMHRFAHGEVIAREGDYANSAFLLLTGHAELLTRQLPPEVLGRRETHSTPWPQAIWDWMRPSNVREARRADQVVPQVDLQPSLTHADSRPPVLHLQDFDGLVRAGQSVHLSPGELFGEVAAMYRSPRSATVVSQGDSTLLEIRMQGLKMLRRDRQFADRMDTHYRENWLPLHLREIPLFRFLPESSLQRVVAATTQRSFGRLEWNADYSKTRKLSPAEQIESEPVIASEGHQVTDLIIVRSGFGRLCQSYGTTQRTIAYLGKGHSFGLEEIAAGLSGDRPITAVPLQSSLRAVGFLDTLHIPIESFVADILPHIRRSELPKAGTHSSSPMAPDPTRPDQVQKRERRSGPRPKVDLPVVSPGTASPNQDATWKNLPSPTGTSFEPTGLLEFIVQNRFNNGREAMVIDLHRCTRCDDCVKACASTHDGNPRFARVGANHDRLQFVQACMHCTDPVCMIGCPTGALHRDEATGLVNISEPICIGCGVCAKGCPYDSIEMVTVNHPDGRPFTDEASNRPISKATKCDMCSGLPSGPACVSACPHDAIVRIDLSESPPLEDWLRRRT